MIRLRCLIFIMLLTICQIGFGAYSWTWETGTNPDLLNQFMSNPDFGNMSMDTITLKNGLTIDNATNNVLEINENTDELKLTFGSNIIAMSSEDVTVFNFGSIVPYVPSMKMLESAGATFYTTITCGDQSGNLTLILPTDTGTSGYQLTTNGSGTLTWAAAAGTANTLDQAYDQGSAGAGKAIDADTGAVAISNDDADNGAFLLTLEAKPGSSASLGGELIIARGNASGNCLNFWNEGSGNDANGTAGTWTISKAGAATFASVSATTSLSSTTTTSVGTNLTVTGNATINGNTTIGNATSDTLTVTAPIIADFYVDDGSGATPALIFKDGTDETVSVSKADSGYLGMTTQAADGVQIFVGNLKVGDGTPGTASMNGEDAYIKGQVEIDGTAQLDGALTCAGGFTTAGAATNINASSNYATNINTGSSDGALTLGGGSGTVAIASTGMDVSTAGAVSGVTTLSMSDDLTMADGKAIKGDTTNAHTIKLQGYDTDPGGYSDLITITNGNPATISFGGNVGTVAINSTDWDIDATGAMTGIGAITADGLITGSLGATISGATTSINANSNFATNVNTGSSDGAVTIGGGSGTVAIASTALDLSTAGALSGITTLSMSGLLTLGNGITVGTGQNERIMFGDTEVIGFYLGTANTAKLITNSGVDTLDVNDVDEIEGVQSIAGDNSQLIDLSINNQITLSDNSEKLGLSFATADTIKLLALSSGVRTLDFNDVDLLIDVNSISGDQGQKIDFERNNEIILSDNSEKLGISFATADTITLMARSSGVDTIDFNDIDTLSDVNTIDSGTDAFMRWITNSKTQKRVVMPLAFATTTEIRAGSPGFPLLGVGLEGVDEIGTTEGYILLGEGADFLRFGIQLPDDFVDDGDATDLVLQFDIWEKAAENLDLEVRIFEYGNATPIITDTIAITDAAARGWVGLVTLSTGIGADADIDAEDVLYVEITQEGADDNEDCWIYGARLTYTTGIQNTQ